MPNTRDQLIADWHKRLAAASEAPEEVSSRAAWLIRLRIRLYRFLLSLYGDGQWRESEDSANKQGSPVVTLVEPRTLEGKPAKDGSTIREALRTFADARTRANEQGPLATGEGENSWTIIASIRSGIDPVSCADVLRSNGIIPRVLRRGSDVTVEVRAKNVSTATNIVASKINALRWYGCPLFPTRPGIIESAIAWLDKSVARIPPRWRFALASIFHVALTFPIAWLGAALVFSLQSDEIKDLPFSEDDFVEQFWTAWRGCFVIALLLIWLRADRQQRRSKSLDQINRRGSTGR